MLSFIVYVSPTTMPWYYHLIPTMSFVRSVNYVTNECMLASCYGHLSQMTQGEAKASIAMLYVHAVVQLALAWYLNQVVPQTYGVPKKWNFLCKSRKGGSAIAYDFDEIGELEDDRESNQRPVYDYDTTLEDADAKAERNIVYNTDKADYYKFPLIIKDIRKEFKGIAGRKNKVATKNFSLKIKKGEMFGLLGPNGAGKTTLISMLTGMFPATRGNAWIAGFDIRNQLEACQL